MKLLRLHSFLKILGPMMSLHNLHINTHNKNSTTSWWGLLFNWARRWFCHEKGDDGKTQWMAYLEFEFSLVIEKRQKINFKYYY